MSGAEPSPALGNKSGRFALIVANDDHQDPGLRRVQRSARDAEALARVLGDPDIGNFDVTLLRNEPEYRLRRRIAAFCSGRQRSDLLLLYFMCLGVKDDSGELYFATPDTVLSELDTTAVAASFVNMHMTRSHSRRVLLILDCSYSAAFARGMLAQ